MMKLLKLILLKHMLDLGLLDEFSDIPEGYVMDGEVARDFLACKDIGDLKKLLVKLKEKNL